jgi:hypothetical protein
LVGGGLAGPDPLRLSMGAGQVASLAHLNSL